MTNREELVKESEKMIIRNRKKKAVMISLSHWLLVANSVLLLILLFRG